MRLWSDQRKTHRPQRAPRWQETVPTPIKGHACGNHNDPILADVLPHAEKDVLPAAGGNFQWVGCRSSARATILNCALMGAGVRPSGREARDRVDPDASCATLPSV